MEYHAGGPQALWMNCPNCGTPNPQTHNFCSHCGTLLVGHCPRCQFTVSGKENFCGKCGLALSPKAQFWWHEDGQLTAGSALDQATTFQFMAGEGGATASLASEAIPEIPTHQTNLDQYIPPELRFKLESARSRGGMIGERRIVTMLFCDVKGSTAAAGQLDPEDWTEIINGAFEYMIRPIYKYEGTVARLLGDGLLAFFGAPIAHEDDPQRCVLAGLDIIAGLAPFRERIQQQWQIDISVRVGINTGLVVVGAMGSDLRMEYTAMGDAVNLAARMEQTAMPGTVQIAHETYRQVSHLFEIEDLGEITVKGKPEPVPAYRVIGRRATFRRKRGIDGLEVEMVGRAQELGILRSILTDLRRGVGRIVCVSAEAGLGKSRLIQELRRILPPDAALSWYEIDSLSYESRVPYSLFRQLVRGLSGIAGDENTEQFWEKIHTLISQIPGSEVSHYTRVIAALFGHPDPFRQSPLEGEPFKRELYSVAEELWQVYFSTQPTLVEFDDLHWADQASIELLLHLLPSIENKPVVLLFALRPRRDVPAHQIAQTTSELYSHRYTEIKLRPLSLEESGELVDRLLDNADLPEDLRGNIQERAGGNPFYVEEIVRTLIERGAVVAEERLENGTLKRYWRGTADSAAIHIPDNLQGLLISRIDRLEQGTRHILQLASVIGRTFYQAVLTEIGRPDKLTVELIEGQIGRLVRLEMIQETARLPDIEYRFRNPMTQEMAYQTILLKQRREYHHRVARALEQLFPDQLLELAPRLAFHFSQAQAADKAMAYFTNAGDNAFRLFAIEEALRNYVQALEWVEEGQASSEQLIHLHGRRGRSLELLLRYDEALETYEYVEALGEARQDDALRLASIAAQAVAYTTGKFDVAKSLKYSEKALALARKLGDRRAEARSLWSLVLAKSWFDTGAALAHGEEGLKIARELTADPGVSNEDLELMGYLLLDLTLPLIGLGHLALASDYAVEAQQLFDQLGNLPMASTAAQRLGLACKAEGKLDQAEKAFEESVAIDASIRNDGGLMGSALGILDLCLYTGNFASFFGQLETLKRVLIHLRTNPAEVCELYPIAAYNQLGALEAALRMTDAVLRFKQNGAVIWADTFLCHLARTKIQVGEPDTAGELLSQIGPDSDLNNYLIPLVPLVPRAKAELALAKGDWQEALVIVDAFLERIRQDHVPLFMPETLLLKSKILCRAGISAEACEALREAHKLASAQQAHPALWRVCSSLAQIEAEKGNQDEAQAFYGQARKAVDFMAENAGKEELRQSFLALPQVQTVLSHTGG